VSEEKALVDFCIKQDALGRPILIKSVASIAFSLACRRPLADRPNKPPGKNWPQLFQKCHIDALRANKSGALDWNRFDIYDKVTDWFEAFGRVLQDPAILQENVYNVVTVRPTQPQLATGLGCEIWNQPMTCSWSLGVES